MTSFTSGEPNSQIRALRVLRDSDKVSVKFYLTIIIISYILNSITIE